jgi:hypothetical protein
MGRHDAANGRDATPLIEPARSGAISPGCVNKQRPDPMRMSHSSPLITARYLETTQSDLDHDRLAAATD